MAEKFFLVISAILQMLMTALLVIQLIRIDIIAVAIHTLLLTFTTGILLAAIEEYRQAKQQKQKQQHS